MEELYGGYSNNRNKGKPEKDGDFQEEDVWGYMKGTDSSSSSSRRVNKSSSTKKLSTPVKINDKKSKRVSKDGSLVSSDGEVYNVESINEEDDYGDGMVPPHEYIARRLARNQLASFSMMEGVGRTLKGRDLSKLRNAILTKTGFLE